jgi:hypothetical protein
MVTITIRPTAMASHREMEARPARAAKADRPTAA